MPEGKSTRSDGNTPAAHQGYAEGEDCPYCDDGVLESLEGYRYTHICSNGGECPATFVVSFPVGEDPGIDQ